MASFTKFYQFAQDLGRGVHNLNADTLKVLLTLTAPVVTNAVKADLTEIAAGSGYSAGGAAVANRAYSHTAGVGKLTGDDVTFTASGGSFAAFRYAVLWNDTPTSPADPLIGFWDYGASITLTDGNIWVVDFNDTNGLLQIT